MPTEHYVLTCNPLATSLEWQAAIQAERYPLRLTAIEGSLLSSATVQADLSGRATSFKLKVVRPTNVVRPWHEGKVPPSWRYAVDLGETGTELSSYAVTLAALAYAARSAGVFYDPGDDDAIVSDLGRMRTVLSELMAVHLTLLGLASGPTRP